MIETIITLPLEEELSEINIKISVLEIDKQYFIEKLKDENVLQIDKDNYRKYKRKVNKDIKKLRKEYYDIVEKQLDFKTNYYEKYGK